MRSTEDYLDQLLAGAIKGKSEENGFSKDEETVNKTDFENVIGEGDSDDKVSQDKACVEISSVENVSEENVSEEKISEEIASEESPVGEFAEDKDGHNDNEEQPDLNKRMTPEEIEALLASIDLDDDENDPDEDEVSAILADLKKASDERSSKNYKKVDFKSAEALYEEAEKQSVFSVDENEVDIVEVNFEETEPVKPIDTEELGNAESADDVTADNSIADSDISEETIAEAEEMTAEAEEPTAEESVETTIEDNTDENEEKDNLSDYSGINIPNFDLPGEAEGLSDEDIYQKNVAHSGQEHLNDDAMSPDDIAMMLARMGAADDDSEETPTETTPVEEAPIEENLTDNSLNDEVQTEEKLPEEVAAEETVPEETLPEETVPEEVSTDNIPEENIETASDDAAGNDAPDMSNEDINELLANIAEGSDTPEDVHELSSEQIEEQADDLLSLLSDDSSQENKTEPTNTDEPVTTSDSFSSIQDMDEDEIENMLNAASDVSDAANVAEEAESKDVLELLEGMKEEDENLGEIGEVLQKSDEAILVDESLSKQYNDAEIAGPDSESAEENKKGKKDKKSIKDIFGKLFKKKEKKDASEESSDAAEPEINPTPNVDEIKDSNETTDSDTAENPVTNNQKDKPEKKKGFFAKIMDTLTEEVEEDSSVPESKKTKITDENKAILEEIDSEEEDGKKKGKKDKKKKKDKPAKEKKAKKDKPKKEKLKEPVDNSKKLPRKYVVATFMFAAAVFVAVLLVASYLPKMINLREARASFYNGNYEDAFFAMYGKELSESDQILYDKAKLIVIMQHKYDAFAQYRAINMNTEALDSLFSGLIKYEDIIEKGEKLGIEDELGEIREDIIAALYDYYDISESEAMEIIEMDELDYTLKLQSVINGTEFVRPQDEINQRYGLTDSNNETQEYDDELQDILPEEREYLEQQ